MKDPAFLFYSNDFLSGTMLMTDEEKGQYITLLCLQHQKGHLKEKDMLSICKEYNEELFSKFEKDENGKYFNKRLEEEITRRKKYSESRRNNRNKCDNSNTSVYLIRNLDNGLVKIGSSNNPERRIIELKNQLGTDNLTLIAFVENVEQKIETKLHKAFADKNKINEWFNLDETDISKIICDYHMKKHMIKDMNNDMQKHMASHMETETATTTENININKNKIKKEEKLLQESFIKCIGSTNLNAIDECISYLKDLPFEVIERALLKTSEANGGWKYAKKILNDWVKDGINTVEKVKTEELNFKNKKQQIEETEEEKIKRKIRELEEAIENGNR